MARAFQMTLGALAAIGTWSAAFLLAVSIAVGALHILVMGGFTIYHLIRS